MNKVGYEKPWAEIVLFENEDVITASGATCTHETGCKGGCRAPGPDDLGICNCGVHEGTQMSGGKPKWICPFLGVLKVPVYETYWCHTNFAQGKAAGVKVENGYSTYSDFGSEDYSVDTETYSCSGFELG